MQFKSIIAASIALAATMAQASYINVFGAEDCNDYTSTSDFPGSGECANLATTAQSWEFYLQGDSGCTVTVYENADCQIELAPPQSGPNKCYDSPVGVNSFSVQCS